MYTLYGVFSEGRLNAGILPMQPKKLFSEFCSLATI